MKELGYTITRQRGSHRQMDAPGLGRVVFAFHDGDEIGPAMVRDILVKQVGLSLERAKEVVRDA
ncbi:type II toxin-antitoxin system HicA family toxin [Nocardioides hungaricus]